MDLLRNAVEAITVGVDDYQSSDSGRVRAAVRSIHAGILLLFKEALRRLSPEGSREVLLKANVRPMRRDGDVVFVGYGKNTVSVHQIRERFESLGIQTDWGRFLRMNGVRNDIEHYYPQVSRAVLDRVISDALVVIRDFVLRELHADPRELLGEDTWKAMLRVAAVHEAERGACDDLLAAIDWRSGALAEGVGLLCCQQCGSDLMQPRGASSDYDDELELVCRSCGASECASDYVPRAIADGLGGEMYLSVKDGGSEPYTTCPECYHEAYIMAEGNCAYCAHAAEHVCAMCSMGIPASEMLSSPLCGWCQYQLSKDD